MKVHSRQTMAWHAVSWTVIVLLSIWWIRTLVATDDSEPYPNRPIEVVVPYPAGGGSDTFVRTLQQGFIEDGLLSQPWVVINVAGGGGTIGSRDVKDAPPDGYRILCHHNAIITAQLSGAVDYGPEAFEPIALTGALTMVVIVREDAPYTDLRHLLNEARRAPKQLTFGANVGAPAYFTTLQLQKSVPGAEFSIVSADGGADRYAKIRGGHLTAGIFSLSEYLDFRSAEGTPADENIRALAVLSRQRHEAIPDVPTAVEQQIPVLLTNANYWWAPLGTPASIIETLATALEKAMQNETVRTDLSRLRMDLDVDTGASFRRHLRDTAESFAAATSEQQHTIPDFSKWVAGLVLSLFVWVLIEALMRASRTTAELDSATGVSSSAADFPRRPLTAAVCFAVLLAYVYILSQRWFPFAISTTIMVLSMGLLMTRGQRRQWGILVRLAVLTGLGTQFIFTEIFSVSLP